MDRVVAERLQEAALAHLVGDAVERAYRRGDPGEAAGTDQRWAFESLNGS
jgi:hypothetical protein